MVDWDDVLRRLDQQLTQFVRMGPKERRALASFTSATYQAEGIPPEVRQRMERLIDQHASRAEQAARQGHPTGPMARTLRAFQRAVVEPGPVTDHLPVTHEERVQTVREYLDSGKESELYRWLAHIRDPAQKQALGRAIEEVRGEMHARHEESRRRREREGAGDDEETERRVAEWEERQRRALEQLDDVIDQDVEPEPPSPPPSPPRPDPEPMEPIEPPDREEERPAPRPEQPLEPVEPEPAPEPPAPRPPSPEPGPPAPEPEPPAPAPEPEPGPAPEPAPEPEPAPQPDPPVAEEEPEPPGEEPELTPEEREQKRKFRELYGDD